MTLKSVLLGGLLATGIGFAPGAGLFEAPAEAKTRIHIGIGTGYPGYHYGDCGPGLIDWCDYGYYRPGWRYRLVPRRHYEENFGQNRSCRAAARAIRQAGYRNIRATDCTGNIFAFRAVKKGKSYRLRVNAVSGRIKVVR